MTEPLFIAFAQGYGRLPVSELEGAMEAEGTAFEMRPGIRGVLRFSADGSSASRAVARLSLSQFMCEELILSRGGAGDISKEIRRGISVPKTESFKLVVKRIGAAVPAESVNIIAREIGGMLAGATRAKVKLVNPERTFVMLVAPDGAVLGVRIVPTARKALPAHRNEVKPFSHHSTLQPEFSRVLVNLARVRRGDLTIDPFCGAGGILIEACELGATSLGLDFKLAMIKGARSNLYKFGYSHFHLAVGDARRCPFTKADAIATDPPYGILSPMIKDRPVSETYQDLVEFSRDALPTNGCLSLVYPSGEAVADMIRNAGLTLISKDEIRVHDSLTRVFAVARR
jgi:tRNA (guanine10-N2)-dimethyltransferase